MSAPIGGQAVLEGVMMRGPSNWAVAVRSPDGDIEHVSRPVESLMQRHRRCPFIVTEQRLGLGAALREAPEARDALAFIGQPLRESDGGPFIGRQMTLGV